MRPVADRPLTKSELTAMFEATDNAELAQQERALRAESQPTPTERAVASLRTQRAAGYSQDNNTRLLLDAYDQLEGSEQELRLKAAVDAKQITELEAELAAANARLRAVLDACDDERGRLLERIAELERAARPSYSTQHVWMVWRDERPIHALYATEADAKQGSIDCWEEDEPSCPDYSWSPHANGRLSLVVGGELADVYISRADVFSKAMADERNATAVTG